MKKVKGWRVSQNHLLLFYFPISFPSHLPFFVTWCHSLRREEPRAEGEACEGGGRWHLQTPL